MLNQQTTGHRLVRTLLAVLVLIATGCGGTTINIESTAPVIDPNGDTDEERTTTSLGLTADGETPPDALAYAEDDRIQVPATDPAIEPFSFLAERIGGDPVDGLDLYRSRPTLITFSVPSCPVCTVEAPEIAAAAEKYPGITFVLVHSQGTADEYRDFITEAGLIGDNIINLVDDDLALWKRFGVVQQPTSVLIDADGHVSSTRGALAAEGLDIVAALLELRDPPSFDHLSPDRPRNPDA